jgi:hypothetical protein
MPGATPTYGFPFPLGSEPVGNGDVGIDALAVAVEDQITATQAPYGGVYRVTDWDGVVSGGVWTKVPFTTDAGGVCSDLANNQLVVPADGDGHYQITARILPKHLPSGAPTSSEWFAAIRINTETLPAIGTDDLGLTRRARYFHAGGSADIDYVEFTTDVDLIAGDIVSLHLSTATTGGVNGVGYCEISMVKPW